MLKISSIVDRERDIMKKNKLFLLLPVLLVACNEINTPSISTPISTSYSSDKTTISVSIADDTSSTLSNTSSNTSESITSDSGVSTSTEELGNSLSTTEEESSTSASNNSTGIEDVNSSTNEENTSTSKDDISSNSTEENSSNSNENINSSPNEEKPSNSTSEDNNSNSSDDNKPSEEIEFYSLIGYVIEYVSNVEGNYLKGQNVGLYKIEQDDTSGEVTSYVATSTTDEDGKYVFNNISKGEYIILLVGILSNDQYKPQTSELKVSVGGNSQIIEISDPLTFIKDNFSTGGLH